MRLRILGALLLLAASAAWAGAQPHMSSSFRLVTPTGQRFDLVTRVHSEADPGPIGVDPGPIAFTEVVLEVEVDPGPISTPGGRDPGPISRTRFEGTTPGAWKPGLAVALFLVAKGYATAADVSAQLGIDLTITRLRGDTATVQMPATDAIVLGLLIAQLQAADPAAALIASRMAEPGPISGPASFQAGITLPAPSAATGL